MKYCATCKSKFDDSVSFCPVDGEVLEDDPSSLVDTILDGQYQMEALLGKGGMGAVYRARHILLGDRVAIKVLPPEVRNNAEWLRRFRREGQAARRFRHPNAVTVYDLRTTADGTIYMVMEYVEGATLDAELKKRGRLNAREAFELLTPIMSVLDTAHSMGVVHRDLKPENIMVGKPDNNGVPVIKLLDLGIAKMREIAGVDSGGNTALTMAGQVLGTPYYMSPEQWGEIPRDQNTEIDGRADIYSLGLVFYEMVSGRRCYGAKTLHELRRDHISTTPPPLCEVVPDVPRGFSDAIAKATAKDRADRQASAAQLAAELKVGLATAPVTGNIAMGSVAEKLPIKAAVPTNSDLDAPTIVEMQGDSTGLPHRDSYVTNPAPTVATAPIHEVVSRPPELRPAPSVAESPTIASVITIPQQTRSEEQAVHAKSRLGLVLGLVALVVVLSVGGVGVYFLLSRQKSTTANVKAPEGGATNTAPVLQEVGKYWLELEPKGAQPAARVAGLVPIASGQSFRFHFTFNDDGYLYLIGPGEKANQPTPFLTSKPASVSGLENNKTTKGMDLSFPTGDGNWLTLDKNPGTENYTVIFSKTPLIAAFLNVPVNGVPLSSDHVTEFNDFTSKYKLNIPSELDESDSRAPFMRVKSEKVNSDKPLVFDIRIQHK